MLQVLHVQIHIKPEFVAQFIEATIENASNSAKEPGIARFDFFQHEDDPTRFELIEVYRNVDAPAAHKATAHYLKWIDTVTDMMAEPRQRVLMHNVFPRDENW